MSQHETKSKNFPDFSPVSKLALNSHNDSPIGILSDFESVINHGRIFQMGKTLCIVVTDNPQHVDQAKGHWQNQQDVAFHSFTPSQWRDGLDQTYFREQLAVGTPSLLAGLRPLATESVGGEPTNNNVINFPPPGSQSRVQKMDEIEAKAIENAIVQYKGNLTEAAKALGIGRATLYRKVKQYQIDPSFARRRKAA